MILRKRPQIRVTPDRMLDISRAEAERERLVAERQAREAENVVTALEQTRLRNGFALAITASILGNRKD